MNSHALDWELHEGVAARQRAAVEAAERERLVRELRAARRDQRRARRRRRTAWWRSCAAEWNELLTGQPVLWKP
ncbi:hypothetical protein [Kineococcus sp. SYSU DK003]|uniref:hypothetical protein n=1 Tax=Kineococcus sp. SYSU DK003 TaxID=3383124 RepID=UPI003D7C3ACD